MSVANPKAPANLLRDFQPIAILHGYAAVIILGRADSEIKTIKDLVTQAQKKPGDLIVAVRPVGTSLTLEVELLRRAAKIDLTSLPFAGSAQAITNLLGGHVNFADGIGRRRAAAYQSRQAHRFRRRCRVGGSSGRADLRQAGLSASQLLASVAFLAPKGVARSHGKILTDAIRKALEEPKLQGKSKIARLQRRPAHDDRGYE